ncbi:MAG: hypothetical protein CM15mP77_0750 [Synechococcus sp.]|nr:MAG: hypothetical protein CM15mP77_0750 [Synechococcus sp.]
MLRRRPGTVTGFLIGHGEVIPQASNRVSLSGAVDRWGVAVPHIDCRWSTNEIAMVAHMRSQMQRCIKAAGGEALPLKDLFRLPLIEPLLQGAVAPIRWRLSAGVLHP